MVKWLLVFFVMSGLFASGLSDQAEADYLVSPPAEQYWIVPDSWLIEKASGSEPMYFLECSFKGVKHRWTIDRFMLADRLDGNAICAGKWKQMTESYLSAETKLSHTDKAIIEVIAKKEGGELSVAGLWTLGAPPQYEKYFVNWSVPKEGKRALETVYNEEQFKSIGNR